MTMSDDAKIKEAEAKCLEKCGRKGKAEDTRAEAKTLKKVEEAKSEGK
jgi:hypothetical protein